MITWLRGLFSIQLDIRQLFPFKPFSRRAAAFENVVFFRPLTAADWIIHRFYFVIIKCIIIPPEAATQRNADHPFPYWRTWPLPLAQWDHHLCHAHCQIVKEARNLFKFALHSVAARAEYRIRPKALKKKYFKIGAKTTKMAPKFKNSCASWPKDGEINFFFPVLCRSEFNASNFGGSKVCIDLPADLRGPLSPSAHFGTRLTASLPRPPQPVNFLVGRSATYTRRPLTYRLRWFL